MKQCQKINCFNDAIPRGKFCEVHRSKRVIKRNIEDDRLRIEKNEHEMMMNLESERLLKMEQDIEYKNTMEQDRLRLEKNEYENILKMSLEQFQIDKKNTLQNEPVNGDFYSIKIKIPTGIILNRNFSLDSKIKDIRTYLDVYFYENKLDIHNYDIIFNIPFFRVTIIDEEKYIKDFSEQKKIMIHICNLDS